jgi:signal transduction histidine kinase
MADRMMDSSDQTLAAAPYRSTDRPFRFRNGFLNMGVQWLGKGHFALPSGGPSSKASQPPRLDSFVSKRRSDKITISALPAREPAPDREISADSPPDLIPHLWRFRTAYRDGRDAEKLLRGATKLGMDLFGAAEGAVVATEPGSGNLRLLHVMPDGSQWDRSMLAGFLRGEEVRVPPELMLARIRRHGRMWGALAVRGPGKTFHWDSRQAFSAVGSLANELIEQIDRERIREVRARVDRKILEPSQPKNLAYELLHAIRSLTGYDHSAALLIYDGESRSLEVVAEQIAWQKAKGQNVGRKLPLAGSLRELFDRPLVCGFNRQGKAWENWTGSDAVGLAELLDYCAEPGDGSAAPPEGTILCASLATRSGLLGILKIASIHPRSFCTYEVELISQFLPQAAVALQNAHRAESLEQRVLAAERKHAMADLARGVSHDVNNALGAVLPLVQQLCEELDANQFDPSVAVCDLRQIEHSIQVCRRIFGAMVHFARGKVRNPSEVSLRHAVDGAMAIFHEGLERRGVRVEIDVPADLPPLIAVQADVEQFLLNLISNARDATGPDDRVAIRARCFDGSLELVVEDTGSGMTREELARIREPFFTTKPDGHGLGLAICRSIVAQLRGQFQIDSSPGSGTTVRAVLPIPQEGG